MSKRLIDAAWAVAVSLALVAGVVAYVKGEQNGEARGRASAVSQVQASDAIEARVMEFVLKKNPDATIRDFADFPRVLISEANAAGIDFRIILALIDKESQFNPRAIGKAGEIGLMQVLPSTGATVAKNLGIPYTPAKGNDLGTLGVPRYNLRIGIAYLKDAVNQFGGPGVNATALRAYNRGPFTAREYRPWDRYAEDIAIGYMQLAQVIR